MWPQRTIHVSEPSPFLVSCLLIPALCNLDPLLKEYHLILLNYLHTFPPEWGIAREKNNHPNTTELGTRRRTLLLIRSKVWAPSSSSIKWEDCMSWFVRSFLAPRLEDFLHKSFRSGALRSRVFDPASVYFVTGHLSYPSSLMASVLLWTSAVDLCTLKVSAPLRESTLCWCLVQ